MTAIAMRTSWVVTIFWIPCGCRLVLKASCSSDVAGPWSITSLMRLSSSLSFLSKLKVSLTSDSFWELLKIFNNTGGYLFALGGNYLLGNTFPKNVGYSCRDDDLKRIPRSFLLTSSPYSYPHHRHFIKRLFNPKTNKGDHKVSSCPSQSNYFTFSSIL